MMSRSVLLLFIRIIPLITILHACKEVVVNEPRENYSNEDVDIIKVNPELAKTVSIEEAFDSIVFLKLELKEEFPINHIDEVFVVDDIFVIVDKKNTAIFIYDRKGKYINHLAKEGKGPGEFLYIQDVKIDYSTEVIHLYDRMQQKILRYTINCEFIDESPVNLYFQTFSILGSNSYALFTTEHDGGKGTLLKYVNKTQELQDQFFIFDPKNGRFHHLLQHISNGFSGLQGNNLILTGSRYIYHIDKPSSPPQVRFLVDFGSYNHQFNPEVILSSSDIEILMQKDVIHSLALCEETKNFVFAVFVGSSINPGGFIYSKKSGEVINFNLFKNLLDDKAFNLFPIGVHDDQLLTSIHPIDLIDKLQGDSDSGNKKYNWNIAKLGPIDVNDNPVLIFYHLKQF